MGNSLIASRLDRLQISGLLRYLITKSSLKSLVEQRTDHVYYGIGLLSNDEPITITILLRDKKRICLVELPNCALIHDFESIDDVIKIGTKISSIISTMS